MLRQITNSLSNIHFTPNFFSFLFYSCCLYKALDFTPALYDFLFKRSKSTDGKDPSQPRFGKYNLPLARCMFFSDTQISCMSHVEDSCADENCLKKNLSELFDLIRTAQNEILLCCYSFTFKDLAQVVMEAADRGVKVRVISNFASATNDSAVIDFHKKGIPIKMTESNYIFHHKFFILDQKVLINGSTNFTEKGIFGNYDSLLVTSDRFFIDAFAEEFDNLWKSAQLTY